MLPNNDHWFVFGAGLSTRDTTIEHVNVHMHNFEFCIQNGFWFFHYNLVQSYNKTNLICICDVLNHKRDLLLKFCVFDYR